MPQKPRVNDWILSIILFACLSLIVLGLYIFASSLKNKQESEVVTPVEQSVSNNSRRKIRFGMTFNESSADFILNNAQPGDIYAITISAKVDQIKEKALKLPKENRMLIVASMEGAEQKIEELKRSGIETSYLGYDLEGWSKTSEDEKQDLVEAVKKASQVAHSKGLKLVIGPSRYFNEKYGKELAKYTDIYMPQAKAYEARYGVSEYAKVVGTLLTDIKASNPEVELWLDISPEPKQTSKTPEEMHEYYKSVEKHIDGVWVTQNQADIESISKFESLLSEK